MDVYTLALDFQEVFLLLYGWFIFWALVLYAVASVILAAALPFLTVREG